ncbi:MAG: hypothetical protein JXR83_05860 [Deltaproteobacteria bacterium]|nr:hypothetical protein [Deltaproteobacteria bacterium]
MTLANVALDVMREALARRFILAIFVAIGLGLLTVALALDLEVVQGTLAASRLFGQRLQGTAIIPVDVALRKLFGILVYLFFYNGVVLGVVASSQIAVSLLAPGRVELLLSLPVRRAELVIGTYLGVLLIALLATAAGVGGLSLVLFYKTHVVTAAPLAAAIAGLIGFGAVYSVMLLATALVRSPSLASATGLGVLALGAAASDRATFLSLFDAGWVRRAVEIAVAPLPRFHLLAEAGARAAEAGQGWPGDTLPLLGSTLAFALAGVAAAVFVIGRKDY